MSTCPSTSALCAAAVDRYSLMKVVPDDSSPVGTLSREFCGMEFVIQRCPPEPTVAKGLERTWLLTATGICDESGTVLGRIERRTCSEGAVCGTIQDMLWQKGVVTAVFTARSGPTSEFSFTFDDRQMIVHPLNHFICEEIHARTVLSWFPEGQCTYSVDDNVDPISALFLYQMLERIDASTE